MIRKIVRIDEDKCDGCGLCVPDCAEGAIQIIDGKAKLLADNLCDGLGNCLGVCPRDAIAIEERQADDFDEVAVRAAQEAVAEKPAETPCGCPGAMARSLPPQTAPCEQAETRASQLSHWPVQLTLVPPSGAMWDDADVLISADCVAFAMADFHERLLSGKVVVIACPKLDDVGPYIDKLTRIFADNSIRSVTVAHMEVPCCTGIVMLTQAAMEKSGRTDIPFADITVGIDGTIHSDTSRA
ncbi:MAG: 4Fe-4S ferredoxin [bacterium]|nr:4Fe-4S ferredoxin [bacterium]